MTSSRSFWQLLTSSSDSPAIHSVAIPMLQRDYAQGRPDPDTAAKRRAFVEALRGAFAPTPAGKTVQPLGLDFVYGTLDNGVLTPLDGQQRLTTLWLLHWYLAARTNCDLSEALGRFSYDARVSARDFGQALATQCRSLPPLKANQLADHLANQPWFQLAWHRDATVRGMLTMINEIHRQFADVDAPAALAALLGKTAPAPITFEFLNLGEHHLSDRLYTRMNARGKALTPFENWKAQFDELLCKHHPDRAQEFANKLDGDWTDCFWRNRDRSKEAGNDPAQLVDAPMLAFFDFVTRMLWLRAFPEKQDATTADATGVVTLEHYFAVYEKQPQTQRSADFKFLVDALTTLTAVNEPMDDWFAGLLSTQWPVEASHRPVRLLTGWGPKGVANSSQVNLLRTCCHRAAESGTWWVDQLLFFTTLVYGAQRGTLPAADPVLRDLLRIVRNRLLSERSAARYSFDLNSERIKVKLPVLLREITMLAEAVAADAATGADAYTTLVKWAGGNEAAAKSYTHELQKAPFMAPSSRWREQLLRVEDSEHFRGALHLLKLTTLQRDETTLKLKIDAVESLWLNPAIADSSKFTNLVIRALMATSDDTFGAYDGNYLFLGGKTNGWNRLLTRDTAPAAAIAFDAFAAQYARASGATWESRLDAVISEQLPRLRKYVVSDNTESGNWRRRWSYYFAKYPGMAFQENEYKSCLYKWWNWQTVGRYYQSCALLSNKILKGANLNPFVSAAYEVYQQRLTTSGGVPNKFKMNYFYAQTGDEHPLLIELEATSAMPAVDIALCYGHDNPRDWRGWRLVSDHPLPEEIKDQFIFFPRVHEDEPNNTQHWLVGRKNLDDTRADLDDIELVIQFAEAWAAARAASPPANV